MGEEKRKQDLGLEAQRHLEETIAAASLILSSMNDELCKSSLWSPHPSPAQLAANGDLSGGGALDDARLRYKSAVAALRHAISAIAASRGDGRGSVLSEARVDPNVILRLEEHASSLRKEIATKNKQVKFLMDQLRDLISDLSVWQSPISQ